MIITIKVLKGKLLLKFIDYKDIKLKSKRSKGHQSQMRGFKMKGLIQSTILVISLFSLSFTSSSAIDTQSELSNKITISIDTQLASGPRCEPYPECQLSISEQPISGATYQRETYQRASGDKQSQPRQLLSEIYRFDKMVMIG